VVLYASDVSWMLEKVSNIPYWKFLVASWLWIGVLALGATLWAQGRRSNPTLFMHHAIFTGCSRYSSIIG